MRWIWPAIGLSLVASAASADAPTQFWNRSAHAVVSLRLSHAGSGEYGDNLALGREVAPDGRLDIVDLHSSRYDLELKFKDGRTCLARHVEVVEGKAFSVADKALFDCGKR